MCPVIYFFLEVKNSTSNYSEYNLINCRDNIFITDLDRALVANIRVMFFSVFPSKENQRRGKNFPSSIKMTHQRETSTMKGSVLLIHAETCSLRR